MRLAHILKQVKGLGSIPLPEYSGRQSRPQIDEVCGLSPLGSKNGGEIKLGSFNENNGKKPLENDISTGVKVRIPMYLHPKTLEKVDDIYKSDNCSTRTEFLEKAVLFYLGYLAAQKNVNYIAPQITSAIEAIILGSEQRISRNLFKLAVEEGKLAHIIAATNSIDTGSLEKLHRMCVEEVKHINGTIRTEDAIEFQKG